MLKMYLFKSYKGLRFNSQSSNKYEESLRADDFIIYRKYITYQCGAQSSITSEDIVVSNYNMLTVSQLLFVKSSLMFSRT